MIEKRAGFCYNKSRAGHPVLLYGDALVSTGLLRLDKRVEDPRWPLKKTGNFIIANNTALVAA